MSSKTFCPICGRKEFYLLHFRMRGGSNPYPVETWRCAVCKHSEERHY